MTDPLMSRIKAAAERDTRGGTSTGDIPTDEDIRSVNKYAFIRGAQFLLTELSRVSEGHGPRARLQPDILKLSEECHCYIVSENSYVPPEQQVYIPLTELIAAKAAHALEVESLETVLATMGVDYGAKLSASQQRIAETAEAAGSGDGRGV